MAEPSESQRQNRSYSKNVASDHSRQQNGDQHHRYERVGAVYHGDIQRVATPTDRGGILSPTRWVTVRENGEALIDAARQGQIERMRRLLASKYMDIDFVDKQRNTALLAAVQGKQQAAVTLLLKEGANPGRRHSLQCETPLILAVSLESQCLMEDTQIIGKGKQKIQMTFKSMTVESLIEAAKKGRIERINELLSKQYINVNSFDKQQRTALLAAVENERSAAVTVLLERGALPGLRHDERCKTPLMLAAYSGDLDIFRTLLAHGAPLVGFDIGEEVVSRACQYLEYEFDTLMGGPIDIMRTAIFRSDPTIVLELLKGGLPAQKGALLPALYQMPENVEVIQKLIDAGADVEAQEGSGERPLHLAATLGFTKTIEILHAAGADLEAGGFGGRTALHFAANFGNVEALQRLIAMGTNIEARDVTYRTPLHIATLSFQFDVIQILLDSGSDAFAVDNFGRSTPYDCTYLLGNAGRETERRKIMDLLRFHMDIDDDGAEVKSFVTAYSRSEQSSGG